MGNQDGMRVMPNRRLDDFASIHASLRKRSSEYFVVTLNINGEEVRLFIRVRPLKT
ncbi:Uncharacterised protein [Achromobacter aegrifaciens]|uniref:Uncharacterized protein n=1 Tax=Achromobacter aegrifaciens TaxID=1287736 RepID=A0AAD2J4Q1_ACHAE|nr:Uncharacterised protein [Achromobacter aegrifaciens]